MKNISLKGLLLGLFVSIVSVMECTISAAPGYVDDPSVSVPAGAYTTFSTVYNGKRYYLGIDTIKAASGIDTVAAYDRPCYAAMWKVGSSYSPRGEVLADENYLRTIQSVWIEEKCSGRKRYLSLGENKGTYSTVVLRDTTRAAMWYTAKDDLAQSKYIHGFLYYYSDATGVDVYRYLSYDPLYGFRRAYSRKPSVSQRISVWDRKQGSDLIFDIHPKTFTIGWETNGNDTTKYPITSQVIFYDNIDRFRSRFDQTDIYAVQTKPITNQETLINPPYNLLGYYEWQTNQTVDESDITAYNGKSYMPFYKVTDIDMQGSEDPADWKLVYGWVDSTVLYVKEDGFRRVGDVWYDTIYAIGSAPFDVLKKPSGGGAPTAGNYANHNDWLYVHFTCEGKQYTDSILVSRHTFHNAPYTTMRMSSSPTDHVFPYTYNNKLVNDIDISETDTACTFSISAHYRAGNNVMNTVNAIVNTYIGEERDLNLRALSAHEDLSVLYDTLLVAAYEADGVTPCDWVESIRLGEKDEIKVKVKQYNSTAMVNRTAQIQYTYRYWHSGAEGDQVSTTRTLWITQKWHGADDAKLYSFAHKDVGDNGLQKVYEKKVTMYAIPDEDISLPLHRDLWGYYRWFIYDGDDKDRDVTYNTNTWKYSDEPLNTLNGTFIPINNYTSSSSRGRWDMSMGSPNHYTMNQPTPIPSIKYPASNSASIKVACDVSAYKDVVYEGKLDPLDLSSLTEPTLSYRNVFDIQPAKVIADRMSECRTGGNWLEERMIVAPAGRAIDLQPQYAIDKNSASGTDALIHEDELQYIYYANPDTTKEGISVGMSDANFTNPDFYNRIGNKKSVTPAKKKKVTLLPFSELTKLNSGDEIDNIVLVNPRKETGYIVGFTGTQKPSYMNYTPYRNTKDALEDALATQMETKGLDGYLLTIKCKNKSKKEFTIMKEDYELYDLYTLVGEWEYLTYNVRWYDGIPTGSSTFELASYDKSTTNLPSGYSTGDLVTFYADWGGRLIGHEGYLKANPGRIKSDDPNTLNSYYAWAIYKIEDEESQIHEEIPRWEKYNGSEWKTVVEWDYSEHQGVAKEEGYSMRADGSLEISEEVHKTADDTILYRLRTQHFQLAKCTLVTRDPNKEGPLLGQGSILSEEEIETNYRILYDLGKDKWSAPGTSEEQAYYHRLPWDFTELSYHYPTSVIGNEYRDSITNMPLKGEYAFINTFVVPKGGKNTGNTGERIECLAGAKNGYMLCVNADNKRTTIMNFEYPGMSCSNQQIFLVANFCNPVKNPYDPQITADLEGWDGTKWVAIYRFKTGKIEYQEGSKKWYQMVLPIDREKIKGYEKFRCTARLNGATNKNAQLLIDRLRFIEKSRTFSVFQNKATCIKEDSVTALIRLNYHADPELYKPGRLVAYQFQKWDASANGGAGDYVPMNASKKISDSPVEYEALTDKTTPTLEVFPGYIKDGFTAKEGVESPSMKTSAGNDYGYVLIPESNYDPYASESEGGQSALRGALIDQVLGILGITGSDADTRKANFLNETENIRTFDQVVSHDYVDFGNMSTPHIKSFVKEGDQWVLYIVCRLPVRATNNHTFRIGMTVMEDIYDTPTFTEAGCATFREFDIKQTTSLLVDGESWPNYTREEIESDPSKELLAPNETYRASIRLTPPSAGDKVTKNARCKFDMLHASAEVRNDDDAFAAKYGCTRTQFVDDMEAFRINDERNVMRDISDWSSVKAEYFTLTGRTKELANAIYNRLDHLVKTGVLEIGLDYRDIYMGDRADSYFYLLPVPATGLYDVVNGNKSGKADTTLHASVCNDTLWLQLHSLLPEYKLRYGYDSRVGDTYIVPTIRATRSQANGENGEKLKVRIAHITRESDKATVIGYNSTHLKQTNDTSWHAGDDSEVFIYTQDKDVRGHNLDGYYQEGSIVQFSPKAGTTFSLKAGYWYMFESAFYGVVDPTATYNVDESNEANVKGHTQFILAIAPDTAVWTPSHPDASNYWNDDANWTPKGPGLDKVDVIARVPMGDTRVIIPQTAEGELPVVNDHVIESKDTLHYGYAKNTCKEILFKPQAMMLGQEKLEYNKAFVDALFLQGQWQTFSPALNNVYSGDMYIPETVANDKDFLPEVFATGSEWGPNHNRTWPYAFYQGFYNTTVPVVFHNTDIEGNPMEKNTKSSADWVKTNVLDKPYKPGEAVILLGFGPDDKAEGTELVVRLPKQETSYQYIGQNGQEGQSVKLERPAFSDINKNLYYDKDNLGDKEGITKTLTNETASKVFFFGNSTMALVDIWELCNDNKDVIEAGGTPNSYRFTAYLLGDGSSYSTRVVTGPGQFFVAPQRAVGLIAKEASNSINIILKPHAMVAMTVSGETIHNPNAQRGGTARTATKAEVQPQEAWLYISAANMTDDGLSKAYYTLGCNATAARGYKEGEDALSLVSGLNYYNAGSLATPLSMYSIADNRPVMLDVRDTVSMVPLAFTTLDEHYSYDEVTLLSFATKGEWNGPLYLYDALTGDSVMIIDGIQVAIQTPENDQVRYYINHNIVPITEPVIDPVDPITTSTAEVNKQNVASNYAEVYDLLGRRVAVMQKNELIHHLGLPTGVYVIQRGTEVEKIVVR